MRETSDMVFCKHLLLSVCLLVPHPVTFVLVIPDSAQRLHMELRWNSTGVITCYLPGSWTDLIKLHFWGRLLLPHATFFPLGVPNVATAEKCFWKFTKVLFLSPSLPLQRFSHRCDQTQLGDKCCFILWAGWWQPTWVETQYQPLEYSQIHNTWEIIQSFKLK